jgi:hypothetical protein
MKLSAFSGADVMVEEAIAMQVDVKRPPSLAGTSKSADHIISLKCVATC